MVGACLLAACTLGAVAASAAWAEAPEYGKCVAAGKEKVEWTEGTTTRSKDVSTGAFTTNKCTVKDTTDKYRLKGPNPGPEGKYEWVPGAGEAAFESSGGEGILQEVEGGKAECKEEHSGGHFVIGNNKEEAGIVVHFTGCKSLGTPCTTPGANTGEVVTKEMVGVLGWENKAAKKTDLLLRAAGGGQITELICTGLVIKVRGSVLVPIKNDKMVSSETLKYEASKGVQKPSAWEQGPAFLEAAFSNFKGGEYSPAGQSITATVKYTGVTQEKLELNAVV
jgi:hypothetical protein